LCRISTKFVKTKITKIKTMVKENFKIIFAVISISSVLSGCAGNSAPESAKTSNANQSQTVLNNNTSQPPAVSNNNTTQPAAAFNNNSAAADSRGNSTPGAADNSSTVVNTAGKDKKPSSPAPDAPKPQIGGGGGDLLLFTQVRGALSSDNELSSAVIIEIKDGNVVLTGNVSSEAQRAKAVQLVQGVKGIKSVKNNLRAAS